MSHTAPRLAALLAALSLLLASLYLGLWTGPELALVDAARAATPAPDTLAALSSALLRAGLAAVGASPFGARAAAFLLLLLASLGLARSLRASLEAPASDLAAAVLLTLPLGWSSALHPGPAALVLALSAALFALSLSRAGEPPTRGSLALRWLCRLGLLSVALAAARDGRPLGLAATLEALAHRSFPWSGPLALGAAALLRSPPEESPAQRYLRRETLGALTLALLTASLRGSEATLALAAAPLAAVAARSLLVARAGSTAPWLALLASLVVARDLAQYPSALHALDAIHGAADGPALASPERSVAPLLALGALSLAVAVSYLRRAPAPHLALTAALLSCFALQHGLERGLTLRRSPEQRLRLLAARVHGAPRLAALEEGDSHLAALAPLSRAPLFRAAEPAGAWLAEAPGPRYLLLRTEQLGALDSAFRLRAGRHPGLLGEGTEGWLLATSTDEGSANPLAVCVGNGPLAPAPGALLRALGTRFGDAVELRAVELPGPATTLRPGGTASLALHLAVQAPLRSDYELFVHVDGPCPRIHAEHAPCEGRYGTSLWRAGEHVRDRFDVAIPWHCPRGRYPVYAGFYRGASRLPVTRGAQAGEDRVLAATLEVR